MPTFTDAQIDAAVPNVPTVEPDYVAGQPRRDDLNEVLKAARTDIAALETGKADATATSTALAALTAAQTAQAEDIAALEAGKADATATTAALAALTAAQTAQAEDIAALETGKVSTSTLVSPGALPDAGVPTDKLLVIRDVGGVPTPHEQSREEFEAGTVKATQFPGGGVVLHAGSSDVIGIACAAVNPPATNLTAAAGSAGALTGAYYYSTAFLLDDGTVTPPWPGTATVVNVTTQQVNLSSIPVSDSPSVVGRVLLRTKATPVDAKAYFVLTTISDNTTTTYTDNTADAALTATANWFGTAGGSMIDANGAVIRGLGGQSQSLAFGSGANAGYASVHIGWDSGKDTTIGRRNVSVGVYSHENVTSGYNNTGVGTHAGGGITTSQSNVHVGCYSGGATKVNGDLNTLVGAETGAGTGGATLGSRNVLVGYRAGYSINTADDVVAIGTQAGQFANASRQLFIDTNGGNRANIAANQDSGLIYGKGESTAQTQVLHFNAAVRVGWGSATVAQLPAASASLRGFRTWVGDASVAYTSASVGSTVAGGGLNAVPVFCNGTAWVIG